jgi:predicted MFS family arabinose efflux permease
MAEREKEPVLHELRHEPVPGFARPFLIIAAIAIAYLAVILFSSPGKAEKHHGDKPATTDAHAQRNAQP